ncbi:MAG: acetylxylan esterase [Verrucomicrobiales bacterium]|nr:acetylxylan esterase [Verrucomicrobiales bacterium]
MRREQLQDMLGLKPWPERGDLHPVITGRIEREDFAVEKLQFQSLPGLYVTGDLYLPKDVPKPAPAILYVCGHSYQIKDGVSFGNKAGYQHHGIWFAQHGYVCLIIDTLQLGEIQGIHHGTYREGRWWWNSRGYTPGGVEAWNSIRALDYLQTRPEVDSERFGMTGRSGGGAYSWFAAALDKRIKVVAPVAGITDLQNHVVDGTVEGHCDCMFFVNTYRWDYPMLAALVAPRPLLLCNSDKDSIFPLDGVLRVHGTLKRIYDGWGVGDRLGLLITEGPHKDTQDLQVPVFRWFNRWLKQEDPLIQRAAEKRLEPAELRVFDELPADEINTRIDELFVPLAKEPAVPENANEWAKLRDQWISGLKDKVFRGWPEESRNPPVPINRNLVPFDKHCQLGTARVPVGDGVYLPLVTLELNEKRPSNSEILLVVCSPDQWATVIGEIQAHEYSATTGSDRKVLLETIGATDSVADQPNEPEAPFIDSMMNVVYGLRLSASVAPRGIGATAWSVDARKQVQIRRRFMLLGQTLAGMRVRDVIQTVRALRELPAQTGLPVTLVADNDMAMNALLAAIMEPGITELVLKRLPGSYRDAPDYLNLARVADVPQLLALAAERTQIVLWDTSPEVARFANAVGEKLGWKPVVCEASSE